METKELGASFFLEEIANASAANVSEKEGGALPRRTSESWTAQHFYLLSTW